jgi:hypothetical protein
MDLDLRAAFWVWGFLVHVDLCEARLVEVWRIHIDGCLIAHVRLVLQREAC